ncbi:hypothetical protein V8B97DRAFT_1317885 [Scleroderma yunnanense]
MAMHVAVPDIRSDLVCKHKKCFNAISPLTMDIATLALYVHALQDLFIGSFISLIFYGVSCVQTFFYFQTYPDDHMLLKYLVAIIWILESAHSGFVIAFNNSYLIEGFGDFTVITQINWPFVVNIEIGLVVIVFVNLFYVWRVWILSRKIWVVLLLFFLTIIRFVLGSVSTMLACINATWGLYQNDSYVLLGISMGLAAFEDTVIAATLAYYLHSKRTQSSTRLITRLLVYIVGTGTLTSMFSIIELIAILASPNTLLYIPFALIQVKLYANSALLSLNLRQYQRGKDVVPSLG